MADNIDLILKAIAFAARQHDGQTRKDKKTPYVSHPFRVAMILSHAFGVKDVRVLAAAVLHDTIEDTAADFDDLEKEFGRDVAVWVGLLSKDTRKQAPAREAEYLKILAEAPDEVKLIKLGDIYDNATDPGILKGPEHAAKTRIKVGQYLMAVSQTKSESVIRALGYVKAFVESMENR